MHDGVAVYSTNAGTCTQSGHVRLGKESIEINMVLHHYDELLYHYDELLYHNGDDLLQCISPESLLHC